MTRGFLVIFVIALLVSCSGSNHIAEDSIPQSSEILQPKNMPYELAKIACTTGKFEHLDSLVVHALEIDSTNASLHALHAQYFIYIKDYRNALASIEKAILISPDPGFKFRRGEISKALLETSKETKISPSTKLSYFYKKMPIPAGGYSAINEGVNIPSSIRKSGDPHSFMFSVFVDYKGNVRAVAKLKASPIQEINMAIEESLLSTKFTPATLEDLPVGVWFVVPINLTI